MPISPLRTILAAACVLALLAAAPAQAAGGQDKVLDFCLKNRGACAISVAAVSEKWERHLNPDRPQSLGSTFKVLSLIAYAQAVAAGKLKATDKIDREEWARYLTLDGGALTRSWNDLGQPTQLELDDLATMMILNSDNAFPDWLLARLPAQDVAKARQLFPFHDHPAPISAMFGLFQGAQGEGGSGNRIAADYGDFGAGDFQAEVQTFFTSLKTQQAAVDRARDALCVQPPWRPGSPPCHPTQPGITEANYRTVLREFFNRSNTRSYLKVYKGLLEGNLLPAPAQQVVRKHLESWFDLFPTLRPAFTRYGIKGGSLATGQGLDVLTWAHYMELSNRQRYVTIVFLQSLRETSNPPTAADLNDFAQQFALNGTFRSKVKKALASKDTRPELLTRITSVERQGNNLTLKARIENTSPNSITRPFQVELRLSNDGNPNIFTLLKSAQIATLKGNQGVDVTLTGTATTDPRGRLAIVFVDTKNGVAEQDEGNNINWSRVR